MGVTQKQADVLADFGYNPDHFSFEQATEVMTALKANGWNPLPGGPAPNPHRRGPRGGGNGGGYQGRPTGGGGGYGYQGNRGGNGGGQRTPRDPNGPCSPRQAELLTQYGYNSNVTSGEASDILGRLKANNWQPLDGGQAPPRTQYAPPQGHQHQPQQPAPHQQGAYTAAPPTYAAPQQQPQYGGPVQAQQPYPTPAPAQAYPQPPVGQGIPAGW